MNAKVLKSSRDSRLFVLKPSRVEHFHVNNNAIEKVDNFNFLGLHLNTRLTWHTHVSEISKKISRAVGIIKKMQWIFSH